MGELARGADTTHTCRNQGAWIGHILGLGPRLPGPPSPEILLLLGRNGTLACELAGRRSIRELQSLVNSMECGWVSSPAVNW